MYVVLSTYIYYGKLMCRFTSSVDGRIRTLTFKKMTSATTAGRKKNANFPPPLVSLGTESNATTDKLSPKSEETKTRKKKFFIIFVLLVLFLSVVGINLAYAVHRSIIQDTYCT